MFGFAEALFAGWFDVSKTRPMILGGDMKQEGDRGIGSWAPLCWAWATLDKDELARAPTADEKCECKEFDRAMFRPKHQQSCWPTEIDLLSQPTGPLAIGPAYTSSYIILRCLVNGLPHWATGYLVRQTCRPVDERSGPPCALGWQRTWGLAGACQGTLTAACPWAKLLVTR
jgi:hypothetical protein